jgi:ATP-dependent Clp protease ATP-binding subunit ClpA
MSQLADQTGSNVPDPQLLPFATPTWHATLWADGMIADLNDLLDAPGGWELTAAQGINDDGLIVGRGTIGGCERAFLLTPVPETAARSPTGEARPATFEPPPYIPPTRTGPGSEALDRLVNMGAINLSERARRDELQRAYGRDVEVEQVFASLLEARSVLIVGPGGAGKTAVLHEAIHRMTHGEAPELLCSKQVVQVSTSRLEAGAMNIGGWAETLQTVIDALIEAGDILLYFDDIWNLPNAGRYMGARESFATHLRPYLENRRIVLLGESTPENFSHGRAAGRDVVRGFPLADDHSLMAHLQVLPLAEPDLRATRELLTSVALELEIERGVRIDAPVVDRCVSLARRFLPYEAFPGKAVRLLRQVARAPAPDPTSGHRDGVAAPSRPLVIDTEMVVKAFGQLTELPERLFSDAISLSPDEVHTYFEDRVVGQPEAISAVADVVTLIKAELTDPGRPLGVLLFVGPTGSGKTLLAKTLAEYLFGSEEKLTRFDMSEYQHPQRAGDFSRSLGEALRQKPFSVVLFDEIEKADPLVFDLFLQAFDEGRLTDPEGYTVDMRSAVLVLTSNLGTDTARRRGLGFVEQGQDLQREHVKAVEEFFRPELVNRIDRILVFRTLAAADIRRIARRELGKALVREGVQRRNILLDFDDDVLDVLLRAGFSEQYGARPLQRAIKDLVLVPLARHIARAPGATDQLLELRAANGQVELRPIPLGPVPAVPSPSGATSAEEEEEAAPPRLLTRQERSRQQVEESIAALHTRIEADLVSDRYRALQAQASDLLAEMAKPTFWDDAGQSRGVLATLYQLERITDLFGSLRTRAEALRETVTHLPGARAASSLDHVTTRCEEIETDLAMAELELLASQPSGLVTETAEILVTPVVTPNASDAGDWPAVLTSVYLAWAQHKGYETGPLDDSGPELRFTVRGPSVVGMLRGENGIHRRQLPAERSAGGGRRTLVQLARVRIADVSEGADGEPSGPEPNDVVRVYNFVRTQYVRDPRTGQESDRPREVLSGAIDPFLLSSLKSTDADRPVIMSS